MRHRIFALSVAALSFVVPAALAQAPAGTQPPGTPPPGRSTTQPPAPPGPAPDARFDAPSMIPNDSGAAPAPVLTGTPCMIGDFPGYLGRSFITNTYCLSADFKQLQPIRTPPPTEFPSEIAVEQPPMPGPLYLVRNAQGELVLATQEQLTNYAKVQETYQIAALSLSRGSFKIAENEAVRPQDRLYFTYNYFHRIPTPVLASSGLLTLPANSVLGAPGTYVLSNTLGSTAGGAGVPSNLTSPNVTASNLHRETIGFEKTVFSNNFSIGLRLPFFQSDSAASTSFNPAGLASFASFPSVGEAVTGGNTLDGSRVGDITVILKYAAINDADRVVSGGLVVTAPTGGGIQLADGSRLYSTLLQPWIGAFQSWDRLFVHGFSSVAVPTDDRDLTLFLNDIGVGYFLYRAPENTWLTGITPTVECHINTPMDKQRDGGISASDTVFMTGGVHFGIGQRATLSLSVATPVTGPRPDQVEAAAQLNWRF